jgi:carboxymethylenebutenolidase
MAAYQAAPDGEPAGGIVVVQEAFGVTGHIESICRRLAEEGWLAVAPALFHRQGGPVMRYDDIDAVRPIMAELTAEGIEADMDAALAHLEKQGIDPSRQGIIGFCMGGSVVLHTATTRRIGAGVRCSGGGLATGRFGFQPLLEEATALCTPWIGFFGDRDQSIPVEEVEQLRERVEAAKVDTDVVRYANAGHGFNCDDRPAHYDAEAAGDAWTKAVDWFRRHLGD